jgi:hypothetical protein
MKREGPELESLLRRLSETPDDFLVESRVKRGSVSVPAIVGRLCRVLGQPMPAETLVRFACRLERYDRNHRALTLISCWFLADPWFQNASISPAQLIEVFEVGLAGLAAHRAFDAFVTDPDRREELARFVLAQLGFRPRGESVAEACNRLTTLAIADQKRALLTARWAEERASAIRQQLARKVALESADKWTRE